MRMDGRDADLVFEGYSSVKNSVDFKVYGLPFGNIESCGVNTIG